MSGTTTLHVSAIVTVYRRFETAVQAILSVAAQSLAPREIIVVEDGSNTGIDRWLAEHPELRARYVRHHTNRGLAAARNTGAAEATGDLVAWLDDDDLWLPHRLERQVAMMRERDERCAIVSAAMQTVDACGRLVSTTRPRMRGSIRESICTVGLSTVPSSYLLRRDAWVAIGGLDTDLSTGIDHELYMQLGAAEYDCDYVDTVLVRHIESSRPQMTTDVSNRITGIDRFLDKWQRTLAVWMGDEVASYYVRHYRWAVIAQMGLQLVRQGHSVAGRCQLLNLLCHDQRVFFSNTRHLVGLIGGRAGLVAARCLKYPFSRREYVEAVSPA